MSDTNVSGLTRTELRLTKARRKFIEAARAVVGMEARWINRPTVVQIMENNSIPTPAWMTTEPQMRVSRGVYYLPFIDDNTNTAYILHTPEDAADDDTDTEENTPSSPDISEASW